MQLKLTTAVKITLLKFTEMGTKLWLPKVAGVHPEWCNVMTLKMEIETLSPTVTWQVISEDVTCLHHPKTWCKTEWLWLQNKAAKLQTTPCLVKKNLGQSHHWWVGYRCMKSLSQWNCKSFKLFLQKMFISILMMLLSLKWCFVLHTIQCFFCEIFLCVKFKGFPTYIKLN